MNHLIVRPNDTWQNDFGYISGSVSALEAVQVALDRIEADKTNSLISLDAEGSLRRAASLDELPEDERADLVLFGMPVVVKDNTDVASMRCTIGSEFFRERIPATNAFVVDRLESAGAIVVGKAGLHEFAYGGTSDNPFYGTIRNPWDLKRIPGGSSGGSGSAVAAGLCAGALGTDTGGSVRCPAALNGVTGLRPTQGALSLSGVFPISYSFDQVGPLAYRARDVRVLFETMVGRDPADLKSVKYPSDALSSSVTYNSSEGRRLRIGVPHEYFFSEADHAVSTLVLEAIEKLSQLGFDIVEVATPDARRANDVATMVIRAEALAIHHERLVQDAAMFGEDVRKRLCLGYEIEGYELAQLYEDMRHLKFQLQNVFDECDIIVTPTTPSVAAPIVGTEMISATASMTAFTYPWSLAGMPAISVPVGLSDGLPVGMQLVGSQFRELALCGVAEAFQSTTSFHRLRPDVPAWMRSQI